ncbi:MAG: hypothetical protein CM15mV22_0980 [Eurybiavirus sp.]|nr:MAG: hypothetical protein CM15mV22_0980 [Eurybiavirus sp.]
MMSLEHTSPQKKWVAVLVLNMLLPLSSIFLRRKRKNGKDVIGNIVKAKALKSRLTKENSQVETRFTMIRGLDKYYGLLELGEKYGVFERKGNRIVVGDS